MRIWNIAVPLAILLFVIWALRKNVLWRILLPDFRPSWTRSPLQRLSAAAAEGRLEAVKALIDEGAPVDGSNESGATPLMLAAAEGHAAVVEFLIERGASVRARDEEGWTPLMYAAQEGGVEAVRPLLAKGADVNARGKDGWTPLMCALNVKGNADVVRLLAERGADLDAADEEGTTVSELAKGDAEAEAVLAAAARQRKKR